jgi:hypothetical protein
VPEPPELGGTTALSGGRVWVPANGFPENSGDTIEAARTYLHGLFPERYAHMTDAFLQAAPEMVRFVQSRTPHRFAACDSYPDYHPELPGSTLGGRCLERYTLPGIPPGVSGDQVPGWVARAATPRELAMRIGVDSDGLERAIAEWNSGCEAGHDPASCVSNVRRREARRLDRGKSICTNRSHWSQCLR